MKELKLKIQSDFGFKNATLVYNYCQCCQRFKLQIIKSKNYMARITKQANALFSLQSLENLK